MTPCAIWITVMFVASEWLWEVKRSVEAVELKNGIVG
jgi:hypothetical protein